MLTPSISVVFNPHDQIPYINRIAIFGSGEVTHKKGWPALRSMQSNGSPLAGVLVCSLEPRSGLEGIPHLYHQLEPGDGLLPLDYLYEAGFLSKNVLCILATPSEYHVPLILQLARLCRLAVEKPIAANRRQARLLLPFTQRDFDIYPIDHKIFNASPLTFLAACSRDPSVLERIGHFAGTFHETAGISQGRWQEDCIADVQWHLFSLLTAVFKTGGVPFSVTVDRVWVSCHDLDLEERYAVPTVWTASRIQGRLLRNRQVVTFDFCQAKGASTDDKSAWLCDGDGVLIEKIDLNETGWRAHARAFVELLRPIPNMPQTLADALAVMEIVDASRDIAIEEPGYAFGELPSFCLECESKKS